MHIPQIHRLSFSSLLVAILFTNLLAAQILHEAGHWAVLTLTGRDPVWSLTGLVQLWDRQPLTPSQWVEMVSPNGETGWLRLSALPASNAEWAAFLAAGPLAQLLAIAAGLAIAFFATRPRWRALGLILALVNAFGHFFYQVVSALQGGGGDETLLAHYLGISWPPISLIFGAAAGAGLLVGFGFLPSARARLKWAGALVLGTLPVGPLFMLTNAVIVDQVDADNPFFRPVLGFSMPILLLGLLSLLGIWFVARRWEPPVVESDHPAS